MGRGLEAAGRTRFVVGASALALGIGVGLAGCAANPLEHAAETVTDLLGQVDTVAVQVAASQAMSAVVTFVVANQRLPATLAEAGFTPPEGVAVEIVPTGGLGFSVCASSGDHAFKAENGTVSQVESC